MRPGAWATGLAVALAAAGWVRFHHLGQLSFWYDEVVTMRLARTAGPAALLRELGRIDATRAPLHPLLLQTWLRLVGTSEFAARSLSVVCGLVSIVLTARIARRAFHDVKVGLWSAWLSALSPMLIVYSREARMYAWLVLVTCAAWYALFTLRTRPGQRVWAAYAAWLVALVYSHPLGLLMAVALGSASLIVRAESKLPWRSWLLAHTLGALLIVPWVPRYLDHGPESTVGRLPIRFLLGLPIGFVGGNSLTLLGFVSMICVGLICIRKDPDGRSRPALANPVPSACLLSWLVVPPVLLYAYSAVSHPIFGPARYMLFVAPAFLILVARGLSKLPVWASIPAGLAASALSISAWPALVFAPDLKADWRGAAVALDRVDPSRSMPVVVLSADPKKNVEVETARYYLATRPCVESPPEGQVAYWVGVGVRSGRMAADPMAEDVHVRPGSRTIELPGLRLIEGRGD